MPAFLPFKHELVGSSQNRAGGAFLGNQRARAQRIDVRRPRFDSELLLGEPRETLRMPICSRKQRPGLCNDARQVGEARHR